MFTVTVTEDTINEGDGDAQHVHYQWTGENLNITPFVSALDHLTWEHIPSENPAPSEPVAADEPAAPAAAPKRRKLTKG